MSNIVANTETGNAEEQKCSICLPANNMEKIAALYGLKLGQNFVLLEYCGSGQYDGQVARFEEDGLKVAMLNLGKPESGYLSWKVSHRLLGQLLSAENAADGCPKVCYDLETNVDGFELRRVDE